MKIFSHQIETRWADIDANQHLTHTAYATFATQTRVAWLASIPGCSMQDLLNCGITAVLQKDATQYFREILLSEVVTIDLYFAGISSDNTAWKFIHRIYNAKGKLAAIYTVYGVWLDMRSRKVAVPPQTFITCTANLPRAKDFEEL